MGPIYAQRVLFCGTTYANAKREEFSKYHQSLSKFDVHYLDISAFSAFLGRDNPKPVSMVLILNGRLCRLKIRQTNSKINAWIDDICLVALMNCLKLNQN